MNRAPAWHVRALCRGETAAFDDEHDATVIAAKAICAECPVARQCLEVGLFEPWGVWGGLTTGERRALVKVLQGKNLPKPLDAYAVN